MQRAVRSSSVICTALLAMLAAPLAPGSALQAQTDGTCIPVAERAGRAFGCFITARQELGPLPASPALYWHLDTYGARADAEAARAARSTVVESLGRTWLFTIAPAEWRSHGGTHGERIGPLPLVAADSLAAVYMEGVFQPGMNTMVHRHPGAEAWFTLEGTMCLETPDGTLTQAAGDSGVLVRAGVPMMLTGTGTGPRRSVVLILQDATKPRSTHADDWTPRGLCAGAPGDASVRPGIPTSGQANGSGDRHLMRVAGLTALGAVLGVVAGAVQESREANCSADICGLHGSALNQNTLAGGLIGSVIGFSVGMVVWGVKRN
jgi:quercetin dioxygenase-like cupin family protein